MVLIWQERKIGLHRADAPAWDAAVAHIRRKLNSDVLNLVDFSFHFYRNRIQELSLLKYTFFSAFRFPLILVLGTIDFYDNFIAVSVFMHLKVY